MNRKLIPILLLPLVLALVLLFACDIEETAKDVAGDQIDTSFDEDATLELEPIEASDGGGTQTLDMDCGTTSVAEELKKHDIDEDDVDIDSVDLDFVDAKYAEAVWEPVEVTNMNCMLTMTGSVGTVTVVETGVEKGSSSWTGIDVPSDAVSFINHYLDHRDEEFNYCVECTDADSYSVIWQVRIGVTVKGEIL
ncbi:MAG TPA: hypothetical protein PKW95_17150 [bacterium]|nr:hypothetical protein [bacterium]